MPENLVWYKSIFPELARAMHGPWHANNLKHFLKNVAHHGWATKFFLGFFKQLIGVQI